MERRLLSETELTAAVSTLNDWNVDGNAIKCGRKFDNFAASLAFVNAVGELAEAADHHPDITFGWGYADVLLTTHDRGGVTDVDVALARKIDAI
ncbi:MAG TPA: 4a-hydroxytetrahydrobiopterin dehydratase [Pyrinomonadaceae bacterium]|nr:4a-hydroxytetrahydrobiopterin dehydratase [Pyrinomonadaceae bacterium]